MIRSNLAVICANSDSTVGHGVSVAVPEKFVGTVQFIET